MREPKAKKTPSGMWRCQYTKDGKRHSVTRPTQYEAERDAKLLAGADIPDLTLTEAIDRYILERQNILSPSTIAGYRVIQRNRFQSVMDKPITARIRWQQVINDEVPELSPKTIYNSWGLISSVLKSNNIPVPQVKLPQQIREEHEFFQPDEIKKFLKLIEGHENEAHFLLCLHGLRKSEMLAVTDSDIKDGYIYVRGSIVKSEANTYVSREANKNETSRRMVPIFIDRLKTLPLELTCAPDTIGDRFQRLCRENGLPEIGLHGLRHSFVSLCYYRKISLMVTMKFGGYANPTICQKIYTHLADLELRESEKKLKSFLSPKKSAKKVRNPLKK